MTMIVIPIATAYKAFRHLRNLTFSTENWHFAYSCHVECVHQFLFFFVNELLACTGQTDGQTDGWARHMAHRTAA